MTSISPERRTADRTSSPRTWPRLPLRLAAAAGLVADAYVHQKLAHEYDAVHAAISEGQLFRAEAIVSILAALLILITWRGATRALGFAVAASALVAVVANTYAYLGAIGPLPDMYEPGWFTDKALAAIAEALTILAAAASPWPSLSRRITP